MAITFNMPFPITAYIPKNEKPQRKIPLRQNEHDMIHYQGNSGHTAGMTNSETRKQITINGIPAMT